MADAGFGQGTTLVIGGARSGKSRRAQAIVEEMGGEPVFLATAQAFDAEMAERIALHRADRGPAWRTVECPIDLPPAITVEARPGAVLLVDCLSLWASNLMLAGIGEDAGERLVIALAQAPCPVVLVSNEVGMGIVPDNALARRFRDVAGRLNQQVAAAADAVLMMVAGLELRIK